MKYMSRWALIPLVLLCLLAVIYGCSGSNPALPDIPEGDGDSARITLGSLPESISPGEIIKVPVYIENATGIYAMSFRMTFDPESAEPVGIDSRGFLTENDTVFHPLDIPGIVPIGYAKLDGAGFSGDATICTIEFRVDDPGKFDLQIVNAPEYLVAYDMGHDRLDLIVGGAQ